MTITLLEGAVIIVLLVAAWQIGTAIAPGIIGWLRVQFGEPVEPQNDTTSQNPRTQKEQNDDTREQ